MTIEQQGGKSDGGNPLTSGRAWSVLLLTIVFSLVADLWSKSWAFAHVASQPVVVDRESVIDVATRHDPRAITQFLIPRHDPLPVIPKVLEFTLVLNPGAVFGVGPGQRAFFVTFTVAALAFGLFMFAQWTRANNTFAHVALGLLIGGGIGNLYDRLVFACVRDFIHPLPGLQWPGTFALMGNREVWPYVSNVADLLLLIGIVMLLMYLWRRDSSKQPARAAEHQAN